MATRRPDLEAIPYKNPGFIGGTLLPFLPKQVKAGTQYFSDILSDVSAQTDRTLSEAPTAYSIASASTTFNLAGDEKIHRAKIDSSEIEQLGGLDAAQQKAARKGKRAVMKAIEDAVVAATFGGSGFSSRDILSSFINAINLAKEQVQDYADGRVCLFGARRIIDRLKRYSEITGKMIYTGMVNSAESKDVRNISDDILAGAVGVDVVLAGPSTEWLGAASAYDGWLGVAILPDGNVDPDESIQLGRIPILDLGAGNTMLIESFYSDDLKSEVVDTSMWSEILMLNKEACYILKGIDESNTITTTTA
jgi:hypothetical protein